MKSCAARRRAAPARQASSQNLGLFAQQPHQLGDTLRSLDVEMRDGGDTRQAEQLCDERADLGVVVVDRHAAEQDQIPGRTVELGREDFGGFEWVDGDLVRLQQHTAVGAHRQRGAYRLLRRRGTKTKDRYLAGPGLLFPAQRFFDGEFVIGIQDELHAGFVETLAVGRDFYARFRIGHALDAHRDFHEARKLRYRLAIRNTEMPQLSGSSGGSAFQSSYEWEPSER